MELMQQSASRGVLCRQGRRGPRVPKLEVALPSPALVAAGYVLERRRLRSLPGA